MPSNLLSTYADYLRNVSETELAREIETPSRLRLDGAVSGRRDLTVAYAPFDHINLGADVVLVGLTPGRYQMAAALREARRLLRSGASVAGAAAGAKVHASFSGPMRSNLVAMLDRVGLAAHLGLDSTAALWGAAADRVHFTSALRYPVFVNGANYSGNPDLLRVPLLRDHLARWFGEELAALPCAIIVPLGPKVAAAVEAAAATQGFDRERVLSGLPHPSGANAERIAFFLDRKSRTALSAKVAPDAILARREAIIARVRQIGGQA
jgi:hypothetical protein